MIGACSRRSARTLLLAAGLLLLVAATARSQSVTVTPVPVDDRVVVSFELSDAYTDDVRAAIQSGLPTTFTYDIDLRRSVPAWVDRTIATARVVASVRFDNLTRRYQVTVLRDGRIEHTKVTDDEEAVRHEVAVFQRLPLFSSRVLEPNIEYYVRVRARTKPHNGLFLLPFGTEGVAGSATFTFLPRE